MMKVSVFMQIALLNLITISSTGAGVDSDRGTFLHATQESDYNCREIVADEFALILY